MRNELIQQNKFWRCDDLIRNCKSKFYKVTICGNTADRKWFKGRVWISDPIDYDYSKVIDKYHMFITLDTDEGKKKFFLNSISMWVSWQ